LNIKSQNRFIFSKYCFYFKYQMKSNKIKMEDSQEFNSSKQLELIDNNEKGFVTDKHLPKTNDNKTTEKNRYKTIFNTWMRETSSHGLPNVIKTEYWIMKIFWLLFYGVALSYFIYTLTVSWMNYFAYRTLTSVSNQNDEIVEFVAVDFCNLNPTPYSYKQVEVSNETVYTDAISYYEQSIVNAKSYLFITDILFNNGPESTFKWNQMVISCYFNGVKCTQDDFYYYRDYDYGSCYKFNGGRIKSLKNLTTNGSINTVDYFEEEVDLKSVTDSGASNGLRLEIFVGDPQRVTYSNKNGIKLIVHNSSIDIFPGEQGIEASTGQQTNVAVSRTWTNKLGPPYSNCIRDLNKSIEQFSRSDTNNLTRILTSMRDVYKIKIYNQKFCLQLCKQDYIVETCGCYDTTLPFPSEEMATFYKTNRRGYIEPLDFFNDSRIITPCIRFSRDDIIEWECLTNAQQNYFSEKMRKCLNKCPLECETVRIEQEISTSDYPSLW
jgi:hypothetical protein